MQTVEVVANALPDEQNLQDGLVWVFCSWYLPLVQEVQVNVSVSVPMKQLRSPDPWYPAEQDGVQVDPDKRVEGQFSAAPLGGDLLALVQGMV